MDAITFKEYNNIFPERKDGMSVPISGGSIEMQGKYTPEIVERDRFSFTGKEGLNNTILGWMGGLLGDVKRKTVGSFTSVVPHIPHLKGKIKDGKVMNAFYEFGGKTSKTHGTDENIDKYGMNDASEPILPGTRPGGLPAVEPPSPGTTDKYSGPAIIGPFSAHDQKWKSMVRPLTVYNEDLNREPSNIVLQGSLRTLREIKNKELRRIKERNEKREEKGKVKERMEVIGSTLGGEGFDKKDIYRAVKEMIERDAKRSGLVFQ